MKLSWRTMAFASIALATGAAAACSSSSSNGTADAGAGGGSDSGTKDGGIGNQDSGSGTKDSGGGGPCTSRQVAVDGGTEEISFDLDGGHACDDCLDLDCCTEVGGCFQDSKCLDYQNCLQPCFSSADAGGCEQECATAAGSTVTNEYNAWVSCGSSHCGSVCPFQ